MKRSFFISGLAKHPTREKLIYEKEFCLSKVMMLMDDDVSLFIRIYVSSHDFDLQEAVQFTWVQVQGFFRVGRNGLGLKEHLKLHSLTSDFRYLI